MFFIAFLVFGLVVGFFYSNVGNSVQLIKDLKETVNGKILTEKNKIEINSSNAIRQTLELRKVFSI